MGKLRILIYGYGNPGRRDDGLGPALVNLVENWINSEKISNVSVDSNYQLNIEDAYTIHNYDLVIFADATVEDIDDFVLTRVLGSSKTDFTMHSVHPAFVLDLCNQLYEVVPDVFLLHIKGYDYELKEGLTEKAEENLQNAYHFIKEILLYPNQEIQPKLELITQ